jgi:hypothetical protein
LPHPLAKLRLWRDVRGLLIEKYGCQLGGAPGPACITRTVKGALRTYPVGGLRDNELVSRAVLRSLLRHLQVQPDEFFLK